MAQSPRNDHQPSDGPPGRRARTREGKAFYTIPLTRETKTALDFLAIRLHRTRESLGQEAVADLLAKYEQKTGC
jgi:hypothetical protein